MSTWHLNLFPTDNNAKLEHHPDNEQTTGRIPSICPNLGVLFVICQAKGLLIVLAVQSLGSEGWV
jgi:hypothetical protein